MPSLAHRTKAAFFTAAYALLATGLAAQFHLRHHHPARFPLQGGLARGHSTQGESTSGTASESSNCPTCYHLANGSRATVEIPDGVRSDCDSSGVVPHASDTATPRMAEYYPSNPRAPPSA